MPSFPASHLRAIDIFVKCAESANFSRAAVELGMTPQAVSFHIRQLEDWAQIRLFHRTTRKVRITDEGRSFYQRCRAGMESIAEGFRELRESTVDVAGTVRLAVPYAMSRTYIVPILAEFMRRYPGISVELIAMSHYPDVVEQGIDISILSRHLPRNSFVTRQIASLPLILCATPEYLARHGTPKTMDDLHNHRCVMQRHPVDGKIMPWTFRRHKKLVSLNIAGGLITNDTDTQRQAVLQGIGIGQLASFFASSHIRAGRLEPILIGYTAPPIPISLCMARRTRIPRRNRTLVDFIYQELRKHPDFQPIALR
jgi:DNA-binding transcriptional LysR family regulator